MPKEQNAPLRKHVTPSRSYIRPLLTRNKTISVKKVFFIHYMKVNDTRDKITRLMQFKVIISKRGIGPVCLGCAKAPVENIALEDARAAYQKAKGDPNVEANAAVPLYEAGKILKHAEIATSETQTSHLAYMAEKQTAVAVAIAEQKLAEAER